VTSLTRELTTARQEIEARTATATKAAAAGEAAIAQQRQAFEEERTRVTSLTRELAAARQEIEARTSTATKADAAHEAAAAQQRPALEEERKRVTSLTRELAAARLEIEARAAAATKAAEAAAAPLRQASAEERQRANAPAGEPAAAPRAIEVGVASPPDTRTAGIETTAALTHPTNKDTGVLDRPLLTEAQVSAEAQKLIARAGLFLSQGDINAARIVLERALDIGSAEAGYRLAETYDPQMLSTWRTLGTRGDPAKARELYSRAYANGIEQAKDRMNALQ
jgi:flagellar biosynthesis GTPase FlhF